MLRQDHGYFGAPVASSVRANAPKWLKGAVTDFVRELPPLFFDNKSFDGGFSKWVELCCSRELWRPKAGWRKLAQTCKESNRIRGIAAAARTRGDILSLVVNNVYREAEAVYRKRISPQRKPDEPALSSQVKNIVHRQHCHERRAITFSWLLRFSFMLTAYVDCILCRSATDEQTLATAREHVEVELDFLNERVTLESLSRFVLHMKQQMQTRKWLPWYYEAPGFRNGVVTRAREAASTFCVDIPPLQLLFNDVHGLFRHKVVALTALNAWLVSLLNIRYLNKWEMLTAIFKELRESATGQEEQEQILEELSRKVVDIAIEHPMQHSDKVDQGQILLAKIVPEISNRQSVRSPGRLTFRMVLELHIYLTAFRSLLTELFYLRDLPGPGTIHKAVMLFGQLADRISEIRCMVRPEHSIVLMHWIMKLIENSTAAPQNVVNSVPQECLMYKKGAIGAILGRVFVKLKVHWRPFEFEMNNQLRSDPLVYASVIAEWDPLLAAKIINAEIQITPELRRRYETGAGHGVSLYMYRRIIVCDTIWNRTNGDWKVAGAILAKLHPVWDVVDGDKKVGSITSQGLEFMRTAVGRGNVEAATFYGLLVSSSGWSEVRKSLGIEESTENGIRLILQALENGDFSASIDLANIITSVQAVRPTRPYSKVLVTAIISMMRKMAHFSPIVSLHLGYVYAIGGYDVPADFTAAIQYYKKVLKFSDVTAATRAHAINNMAILITIGPKYAVPNGSKAAEYLTVASLAGNLKSKTNLAAMRCFGVSGIKQNLSSAEAMYRDYFTHTKGQKPVCLMQKSNDPNLVHISQVLVDPRRQEKFLKAIGQGCAPLLPEDFGEVLYSETMPVSRVLGA